MTGAGNDGEVMSDRSDPSDYEHEYELDYEYEHEKEPANEPLAPRP
jgi:hypothetical protein